MLHNDDGDAMHLATGTLCDEDGACVCLECAEVLAPELCAGRGCGGSGMICSKKCDSCAERGECDTPAALAEVQQWEASRGKVRVTLAVEYAVGLTATVWSVLAGKLLNADDRVVLRLFAADITASLPEGPTRRELEGMRSMADRPASERPILDRVRLRN